MPILFSRSFFKCETFGIAEWVAMDRRLLREYGCEDLCRFVIFNFCAEGHRRCFDWKIDFGRNWSLPNTLVVVVTHVLQNKRDREAFRVTMVFSATRKPELKHILFEPTEWLGKKKTKSQHTKSNLKRSCSQSDMSCVSINHLLECVCSEGPKKKIYF
jgi:hypothetical protein